MGLFGNIRKLQTQMVGMEGAVRTSFSRVREDMNAAQAWLRYFQELSGSLQAELQRSAAASETLVAQLEKQRKLLDEQSRELLEIRKRTHHLPKKVDFLADQVARTLTEDKLDFYLSKISKEILHIDRKMEELSYLPSALGTLKEQLEDHLSLPYHSPSVEKRIREMQERLESMIVRKSPKDKLVQKVVRQSTDYLKAMILGYVRKYGKISAYQLREMVVEEQNLTSKSSFYRILEDIEAEEGVGVVRSGKEKIYLYRPPKPVR